MREQDTTTGKIRENVDLEIVPITEVEDPPAEHKESRVNPVLADDRLLHELSDSPAVIEHDGRVLGSQRHGRHRRRTALAAIERQQPMQIDNAKTCTLHGEGCIAP